MVLKRRRPQYYDRKQQLELVLAAQELSEFGDPDLSPIELDEEEGYGAEHNCADLARHGVSETDKGRYTI